VRRLGLCLMVTGFLAGHVCAQPWHRPKTWAEWRADGLAFMFTLTEPQKQQALVLFIALEQASRPLEDKLAQARKELREAVRNPALAQRIDQIAAVIGTLSGQVAALEAKTDVKLYALLTPEQRWKWDHGPPPFPGAPRRESEHKPGER
jgi:Spy/CpxP family protein refolding chaperone